MKHILLIADNEISEKVRNILKDTHYDIIYMSEGDERIETSINKNQLETIIVMIDAWNKEKYASLNTKCIVIDNLGDNKKRIDTLYEGADLIIDYQRLEELAPYLDVLRRYNDRYKNNNKYTLVDNLMMNETEHTVFIDNKEVKLSAKEFETMWLLANNVNRIFTRENLIDILWEYDYSGDNRTVDSHIKRLRAKLSAYKHDNWSIATEWGIGYKFEMKR